MTRRWPNPASFFSPRALTLCSPGQYSPATSPTRAVDAEGSERVPDDRRHLVETGLGTGPRIAIGDRVRDRDRLLVEDRGAAPGEALDRLEATRTRRPHSGPYPWLATSRRPKATIAPGRPSRIVSGSSPADTRSRIAREIAVSSAGRSGIVSLTSRSGRRPGMTRSIAGGGMV